MLNTKVPEKPLRNIVDGEKVIERIIERGGSSPAKEQAVKPEKDYKELNVKYDLQLADDIEELRDLFPKTNPFAKRKGISVHDWIVLAMREKRDRDKRAAE